MQKLILGLDISTKCVGTSIVAYDDESQRLDVIWIHYVKFKKPKDMETIEQLFNNITQFKNTFIKPLKENYPNIQLTDIVIEEPLINSQNAFTCHTLTKFNGMLSQLVFDTYGIIPQYISSHDARKFAFPDLLAIRKYDKDGNLREPKKILKDLKGNKLSLFGDYPLDCEKKEILHNKIATIFTDIKWEYNSKGNLKNENFDASDSLVCVLGYLNKLSYQESLPTITSYVENNTIVDGHETTIINYEFEYCGIKTTKQLIF